MVTDLVAKFPVTSLVEMDTVERVRRRHVKVDELCDPPVPSVPDSRIRQLISEDRVDHLDLSLHLSVLSREDLKDQDPSVRNDIFEVSHALQDTEGDLTWILISGHVCCSDVDDHSVSVGTSESFDVPFEVPDSVAWKSKVLDSSLERRKRVHPVVRPTPSLAVTDQEDLGGGHRSRNRRGPRFRPSDRQTDTAEETDDDTCDDRPDQQ